MLQKLGLYALLIIFLVASSCKSPYHAAKRKKGEQCDCPKGTKTKQPKTKKYR